MFKVECPGCKAPYQVDERRIPSSGLKMRCPKCGTSFKVDAPADPYRTGPTPVLAGPDSSAEPEPPKPRPSPAALKGTMLGVAPAGPPPRPQPLAPKAAAPAASAPIAASPPRAAAPVATHAPAPAPPADDPYGEVDLPAVGAKPVISPPAAPVPAAKPPELSLDLDLPSPATRAPAPAARGDLDLPAVAARTGAAPAGRGPALSAQDLPEVARRVSPAPMSAGFGEIDLPSVSQSHASLPAVGRANPQAGGADLPSVSRGQQGGIELPSISQASLPVVSGADLPSVGGVELPSLGASLPSVGGVGLPSVGGTGLPVADGAGLPAVGGPGLPSAGPGLPVPYGSVRPAERPASISPGTFGELELPEMGGPPSAPRGADSGQFGELELPLVGSDPPLAPAVNQIDPFGSVASHESGRPMSGAPSSGGTPGSEVVRQAGGGTNYGEVNLDGATAQEVPLSAPPAAARPEEDMEFGAIPQEDEHKARAPSARPDTSTRRPTSEPSARKRKLGLRLMAALFGLTVGGASLALLPTIGPFGAYWITDQLKVQEYADLVRSAVQSSTREMAADTYPSARQALEGIDAARAKAKRVKALAAYAAYLGYARELRFGSEPAVHASSNVLVDELAATPDAPYLELARTARAATEGQLARARQLLSALERTQAQSIEVLVLRGELELMARDPQAALVAWQKALLREKSPRTAFGLARAKHAANDVAGAAAQAEQALAENPKHVGARLLLARIGSDTRAGEKRAMETLLDITKGTAHASPEEIVTAQTLLGDIHLSRSRISLAEAAYNEALRINPKAARALTGLGDALCRAGRYSEAQARFEAGAQADPDDILAKVGVARSKLALERVEDANQILKKLRATNPKSLLVAYWYGRVLEAVGNRPEAEAVYREALKNAPQDSQIVDVYIALALLQNQQGRAAEAQKTLDAAQKGLPPSPSIHKALGDVALSQGRYQDAVGEFERAVELDGDDLGSRFRLASALRRDAKYEAASKAFEEVAAVDRDYPGLALELGLLYEASGRADEALKQYESALAKAPNDPDLMLRVGCGKVSAGLAKPAEELLRKVLSQRPTSAETNHCLGRALLVEGTRLADALRALERAVELDPHRAEYHLYVGWAANEAGNVPKAERALDEALKLDKGLADAYWQRGVLRQRQGAVRDAIADLVKALELRPSRYEVHAALAEAYYDLGKEPVALSEWQLAIAAAPNNANWRFRYGKLLTSNHMNEQAQEHLRKAIELGEAMEPDPRWIWEAHHMMARSLAGKAEAAQHWEQFLRLGPRDSPYRKEAKAALEKLGRPWSGD